VIVGTGAPGSTVTVSGPGGTVIGSAVVGGDGGWKVTPSTPVAWGTLVEVVQRDTGGTVTGSQSLLVGVASVAVTASVVPGGSLVVSGTYFQPGETVVAVAHSAPLDLGTQVVAADGTVGFTRVIASGDLEVGSHSVVLTAGRSGTVSAAFEVADGDDATAAPLSTSATTTTIGATGSSTTTTAGKTIASTGGGQLGWRVAVALVLIALGLVLGAANRRRKTAIVRQ
jgi:hypothetical protein